MKKKLLLVVNADWFFLSHRLPIALEAQKQNYEIHVAVGLTDKLEVLEAYGFIVHPLDMQRGSTHVTGILHSVLQIYRVMKAVKPDLVHLVTIKPVLLGGLAARMAKVPAVVAAISGLGFVFLDVGIKAALRRLIVSRFYAIALGHKNLKVIFQNKDDQTRVCRMSGLGSNSIELIRGSGVDLEQYRVKELPSGTPIVILAARLLKDKGVQEFIEAARLLSRSEYAPKHGVRCVLVGEPDPENPSSVTPEALELWREEGVIEVWGRRSDMADVLASATVVVLPSYREGLPKVLIEAAACGRAIVTSDVPGCRDAIEPDVTGILVPARQVEPLAKAIKYLLDRPSLCAEMGGAGRRLAEQAFDVHSVVEEHMRIYRQLVERGAQ
ncbi:glycosyltransferase involved in cell wall biosynthesis [Chromobacterium alkanivorans]|uniref:glycosyltransferase family 4 protein n=1 Tax=Chromobacterium alkanivorans TaxID=1071719 RepID=UPI002169AE28|nr:glycosyltransferase family 4 protein [Chromobacterium alkanivorans]MCS3802724.1 glycosyltransferase involved in cell wall biosynthesis [Chromobacterium alkanivorans]MCS3817050.1 glycosyltransferase involved in cell wall biosynthesis [Chromobacterium alkanivorans]MCS3872090.1 glycosyltransferase involved in cell wall biosynthesis [Chromobacterium alkanivorans]